MKIEQYPNWFASAGGELNFSTHLVKFKGLKVDFVQLGAYTGDATKWLFENILTHPESTLTDVDTWEGSNEEIHKQMDWKDVETVYNEKNSQWLDEGRLIKKKMTTDEFFALNDKQFDFVYVDADHTAMAVLKDGLNGYASLKANGIIAFDDYLWGVENKLDVMSIPKTALDALLIYFRKETTVLDINLQVWLKKVF